MIGEIRMALKQTKSGTTTELDNIPAEAMKSDTEATANILQNDDNDDMREEEEKKKMKDSGCVLLKL
ncbi:unnamed protein product [Schistosoma margrebowiei]|uniref:Uncharacterized protein n=1 Tax=Schistosoma margrebowiei TaxID=48269 RepID=A0A183N3L8_9TREM|nr:unnamed protein product [Schistosoma margrebowiei]